MHGAEFTKKYKVFPQMDGRFFEKHFSFCFRTKELTCAVISLVRKVSSELWARKTVQNSFENSNSYFSSWFSLLSAVNMNIVSIVTFWNFFWTVFRAQRSVEDFRTREMTARVSSFKLKQKEKFLSKIRSSIWGKTLYFFVNSAPRTAKEEQIELRNDGNMHYYGLHKRASLDTPMKVP